MATLVVEVADAAASGTKASTADAAGDANTDADAAGDADADAGAAGDATRLAAYAERLAALVGPGSAASRARARRAPGLSTSDGEVAMGLHARCLVRCVALLDEPAERAARGGELMELFVVDATRCRDEPARTELLRRGVAPLVRFLGHGVALHLRTLLPMLLAFLEPGHAGGACSRSAVHAVAARVGARRGLPRGARPRAPRRRGRRAARPRRRRRRGRARRLRRLTTARLRAAAARASRRTTRASR
ncbi:hypothetical protein JL722_701 [Aureococcus anophagefferens]|nr:hypothetical protein JL722_701 [Aureococcus anophagefferens]